MEALQIQRWAKNPSRFPSGGNFPTPHLLLAGHIADGGGRLDAFLLQLLLRLLDALAIDVAHQHLGTRPP